MKTEEEIIKALEICTFEYIGCAGCPYISDKNCLFHHHSDAINLIRQKQAEIKRLYNNISAMAITMRNSAKETRNEAIREFWDILKAQNTMDERIISVKSGDDLVKEMVGEK